MNSTLFRQLEPMHPSGIINMAIHFTELMIYIAKVWQGHCMLTIGAAIFEVI